MGGSKASGCTLAVIGVAALALAACGGPPAASSGVAAPVVGASPASVAGRPSTAPVASGAPPSPAADAAHQPPPAGVGITFTQPAEGMLMPAGSITATYQVSGIDLIAPAAAKQLADYHLDLLLDVDPTPYITQFQAVPSNNPHIIRTGATTATFENVAAGSHTLTAILTTSNDVSLNPPLTAKVSFQAQ